VSASARLIVALVDKLAKISTHPTWIKIAEKRPIFTFTKLTDEFPVGDALHHLYGRNIWKMLIILPTDLSILIREFTLFDFGFVTYKTGINVLSGQGCHYNRL
jgi:hypothetical protein